MKIAEVRELSTRELMERIDAEKKYLSQKKINHSISPIDNTAQLKKMRKTIARMKTELHWRELNNT
ncbi:MAG: 50S ribosomal protein L29 [Tannerellaceae bacterium]|jgi:large subunit ribosomal protein L29|nr:50S ribosomal protein L29 [Tannerellaceae bacterium]